MTTTLNFTLSKPSGEGDEEVKEIADLLAMFAAKCAAKGYGVSANMHVNKNDGTSKGASLSVSPITPYIY